MSNNSFAGKIQNNLSFRYLVVVERSQKKVKVHSCKTVLNVNSKNTQIAV